MADNRPIGLFDSGVGGLTVWLQITALQPFENTVYVADSFNCPYGPKGAETIIQLSRSIARFLLARHCKLLVVACNTASAAALSTLRAECGVPVVGIEPAVKPAAQATQTGHVGVLATEGALQGQLFRQTSRSYAANVTVHEQVGHELAVLVEAGRLTDPYTETVLRRYLEPMLEANVDQLALGCTHYPFLIPLIRKIVADRMAVIDPAAAVARQVSRVLAQHNLPAGNKSAPVEHCFYSTGNPETLKNMLALCGYHAGEVGTLTWAGGQLSV